ncbi:polysaccharide biosynthesis tyrosine autokinase [Sphaerisporangium fuscum]|uniref:polysaccharide biosynthesis tyrosine autokinase n=1 Tax=Sphaerisporangium fuscum TaxID=2835868 RepID=UPI001BDBB807|nr:polysaccharide biosynthesis tyrosine autokinase [Sphaerisporangium fuscum]
MDPIYYLRLVRRNWALTVLAVLLSVGIALIVTAKTPPKYQATITMLVSGQDKEGSLTTAIQAGALSQQRVQSYANLLSSRRVVGRIAQGDEIGRVQANIKAEALPLTTLLRATVTDGDPRRAALLANKLGTTFSRLIDELERPPHSSRSTVKVTVVDPATVPDRPVSPRPLVNIVVAVLIGLIIAFSSFVLRDRLDTTIKTSEVLHQVSKSPTIGVIGFEKDARQYPLVIREGGRSTRAEAFRSIRTNLQFIGIDRQPRSLVVTSGQEGDGKSSTAANLAIVLAQAGWRVLAVEADLRRPQLADYLGLERSAGLTDVLIGSAKLEEVTQTWGPSSLSVLTSGKIPPNPSEILASQEMRTLLARLRSEYDMVIMDAPPLLAVTDAAALAAICEGTLLVARYGRTRSEHIARATEMLASVNARLVGTVLNFVPTKVARTYGYEQGYGYETVTSGRPSAEVGV